MCSVLTCRRMRSYGSSKAMFRLEAQASFRISCLGLGQNILGTTCGKDHGDVLLDHLPHRMMAR